jgi:delta-aminolevulinic acid dehydratase/porphobilinogen synthase
LAVKEALWDAEEGADMVMVKPKNCLIVMVVQEAKCRPGEHYVSGGVMIKASATKSDG